MNSGFETILLQTQRYRSQKSQSEKSDHVLPIAFFLITLIFVYDWVKNFLISLKNEKHVPKKHVDKQKIGQYKQPHVESKSALKNDSFKANRENRSEMPLTKSPIEKKKKKVFATKNSFLKFENEKLTHCKQQKSFSYSRAKIAIDRLKSKKDLMIFYEIMKKPKGLSEE